MAEKKSDNLTLLVCKTLPPLVIGSTILLKNFFEHYPGRIIAAAGWEYGAKTDESFLLPFKTHYLRFKPSLLQRIFEKLPSLYFYIVELYLTLIIKKHKPKTIFGACTPDGLFFAAAFKVAIKLNIPFYGQMHDLWLENTREGTFFRNLSVKYEKQIFENSNCIYCMTDIQKEYLGEKYPNAKLDVLPHCVPKSEPRSINLSRNKLKKGYRIVYSGNISHAMNLDALKKFVKAINLLPDDYEVTMLVSSSKEELKKMGVYNDKIIYDWKPIDEAREIINNASVLFLPLSFENCSKDEVRTVYATKTLDYLISTVPILVFSPEYSFHSISARKGNWGYVVDENSSTKLANGIIDLCQNEFIKEELLKGVLDELIKRDPVRNGRILYSKLCS